MNQVATEAVLVCQETLAAETVAYTFELATPMPFQAGQFVELAVPGALPRPERAYSIWSGPAEPSRLTLVVKLIRGGAAGEYLRAARVGDRMHLRGPFGHFVMRDTAGPHNFVATGTGLAPFHSMLAEAARGGDRRRFRVWFGVREAADDFGGAALARLEGVLPALSVTRCLSRPGSEWAGFRGRVTDALVAQAPALEGEWYLCGSGPMVDEVRAWLRGRGVAPNAVHVEKY